MNDGVDELKVEYVDKNLFKFNSLERYRELSSKAGNAPGKEGDTSWDGSAVCFPKVISFVRAELISSMTNPKAPFLPIETS